MLEHLRPARNHRIISLFPAVAVGLALGCTTPGLPPERSQTTLTAQTMKRVTTLYLHPERLDRRFLAGALDALERDFDPVRFEHGETKGILWVGDSRAAVPLDSPVDPQEFEEVLGRALNFVEQGLGDKLEQDEDTNLELTALRGALGSLDPYSTIFAGRRTEDFRIHFSGKLKGVGSRVGRRDGQFLALKVFPGSPADKAGLRDDDAILTIDGEPTQPLTVSEAVGKIRGEEGTTVTLGIRREDEELELEIVRGEVTIPTVETRMLEDDIGYLRIFHMSRSTVKEFREKLDELGPLEGLVLDLRGNSGGSMQTSTRLADLFLKEGTILRIVDRKDPTSRNRRNRSMATPEVAYDFPLAILVDSATASGAEILAGALVPLERVILIGQTTFGKGLIQRVYPLPKKHMLKMTVAEYVLSGDRAIHKKGIEPDYVLYPVSSKHLSRLANVPPDAIPYVRATDEDDTFPIDVAVSVLRGSEDQVFGELQAQADSTIEEHLSQAGIPWTRDTQGLPQLLPQAIEIRGESLQLVTGQPTKLQFRVTNPNSFAIPNVWAAVEAPKEYLSNGLVYLGALEAGASVLSEIELTPPDGLSMPRQPVTVHVTSGTQPLQSRRLVLPVTQHAPEIEIAVLRVADDRVEVTLHNRGQFALSGIRIGVPGATSKIEELVPGTPIMEELTLSGEVNAVAVTLRGPGVRRQIDVPIPEDHVAVVPPSIVLERGGLLGRPKLRVRATSPDGLALGWIFLNGQKEVYVDWQGEQDGLLQAQLADGDHDVRSRVETISGVAVTDFWRLTAN